jgi:hypothetical protein
LLHLLWIDKNRAALCLIVASADAAKKKPKGKGNSSPKVSAKAQPLLKQSNFALDGKVQQSVSEQFYLDPEQKYRPTKIRGVDLPNAIAGVPMKELIGRRMEVTFTGSAVARSGNQIKFEPKGFTGVKALDGKPMPKAEKPAGKKPPAKKNTGKKPATPAASGPIATPIADFDKKLPKVLILGAAVSVGYTSAVTKALAGQANVTRPMKGKAAESCRGTAHGRENLKRWLGKTKWELIHFNFGQDDIKAEVDAKNYAKNLEAIAKQLEASGGKVIFANTTPNKQAAAYNIAAKKIMDKLGIPVNDLYGFVKPRVAELKPPGKPQFSKAGFTKIGTQVSNKSRGALKIKAGKAR